MKAPKWQAITESAYEWEREALELVRDHLPDHEPWRAWSNFEFVDDQGRVNEIDLLVLCPRGLILVEIKSRPGTVEGDGHSWVWTTDGRKRTEDNPILLANRKAKRLASLIRRQDALAKSRMRPPFVIEAVFLSKVRPPLKLDARLRERVFLRGRPGREEDDGIVRALTGGLDDAFPDRAAIDANVARVIGRAIEQAGIRPSLRERRVSDYELAEPIADGEGWQDFEAKHVSLGTRRRVRIYAYAQTASKEARERLARSAAREFQVLEGIEHPNILRVLDYRDTERGPALIFEHDPGALRLDHMLRERHAGMSTALRLDLLRQIAESLQYAHEKRLYHRSLAPDSILVRDPDGERPQVKIMNWRTAARSDSSLPTPQRTTGTRHIDEYVADPARVYIAPEARDGLGPAGPHHDVFSLGAIGYHLFTGEPPASSPLELPEKLRRHGGLRISQLVDGVGRDLDDLIQMSTTPEVASRISSVQEFLAYLSDAERELHAGPVEETVDPGEAKPDDPIGRDLVLVERLGSGGSAEALLVTRQGEEAPLVLKIARDTAHNERLRAEAEVLRRLHHQNIVRYVDSFDLAGRFGILMERAGKHTLAWHIRGADPPSLDLASRFGEELLQAVNFLEQEGVAHRDIKPDNIGVAEAPGSGRKRLVLFDFSLSRTPPESIEAGTRPYLDPFLSLRRPLRWDLYAERFAAAVTLYEMLTGTLPVWGDGLSDPALLDCEAAIDADRFDPALRDGLFRFFDRALRRDPSERFGNADDMLKAWREAFAPLDRRADAPESLEVIARRIQADTPVAELGYGIEARDVLDKMGVHKVAQLLAVDRRHFRYLKNVGERIRKEIRRTAKDLARIRADLVPGGDSDSTLPGGASIDRLYLQLPRQHPAVEDTTEDRVLAALLGIDEVDGPGMLPAAGEVARACHVARSAVATALEQARERWHKSRDLNALRDDAALLLTESGGVMAAAELAEALLAARGTVEDEPAERQRKALAVLRAAIELEAAMAEPRFGLHADASPPLVATDDDPVAYARLLGEEADRLAGLDPPPAAERAREELAAVPPPDGMAPLSATRLLRLAAAASTSTALSSRLELYPRGMASRKALRLSLGSLLGIRRLTVEEVRGRVRGRYPDAEPLPDRPALDALLEEAGAARVWRQDGQDGPGYYVRNLAGTTSAVSPRYPTTGAAPEITPHVLEARQLEAKLAHAHRTGGFLVLTVQPRHAARAEAEILGRFPRMRLSLDRLLLDAMHDQAQALEVSWQKVLNADRAPRDSRDFQNLLKLAHRAAPALRRRLMEQAEPALLLHPGLLARYDLLDMLEDMRDASGTRGGPAGLWLLVPQASGGLPMLDGHPIPVLSNAQWAWLGEDWLSNAHRAGTAPAA